MQWYHSRPHTTITSSFPPIGGGGGTPLKICITNFTKNLAERNGYYTWWLEPTGQNAISRQPDRDVLTEISGFTIIYGNRGQTDQVE